MSTILFIDTTQEICQLGLLHEGQLIIEQHTVERQHAAVMNAMITDLLDKQHCNFEALTVIAVCAGPGSYTGIRVGIATAQGIGFARQVPVSYFSALTLLNYQWIKECNSEKGLYTTVLKAREQEVFFEIANEKGQILVQGKHALLEALNQLFNDYANEKMQIQTTLELQVHSKLHVQKIKEIARIDIRQWCQFYELSLSGSLIKDQGLYLKDVFINA
jgi:tRNA threonylcarbamoyladenosine biosynthesis protein TsaB